jgi:hypothetical protein
VVAAISVPKSFISGAKETACLGLHDDCIVAAPSPLARSMETSPQRPRILRSVLAVVAGALVGILLSVGTDLALQAVGFLPRQGTPASSLALMVATLYRTIYGILGAYVTARIAPTRPMLHVTILGSLGLIASLAGAIATWNKVSLYGPHWYPVVLVVLALPTAWLGGRLRGRPSESSRA